MLGISSSGKESIMAAVAKMFDRLSFRLLGRVPKLHNNPVLYEEPVPSLTLVHIFLQVLGNREPTQSERDVLKSLLNSSFGYVESLKHKTSSNVVEAVDAAVKEAAANGDKVDYSLVGKIIQQEMQKAQNGLKLIAEAETTKTRNVGATLHIVKTSKDQGIEDPVCFFVVVRDKNLCHECKTLHMLEDENTPRVWKLSELSMAWHKRGEKRPSSCGEHPHCRCSLQQIPPGWGFKGGFISYIGPDHDEYKKQRGIA